MSCEQTHQKDTETHAAARLFGGGDARARDTQRASPGGHSARRTLALDGNALDSGGSLWRTLSRRACGGRAAGGSLRRTRSQQRVRRAAAARAAGSEWRVAVHCHRPRQPATCARERQRAPAAAARDERPRQLRMPGFARPVSLGRATLMRSACCTSPRVYVLSMFQHDHRELLGKADGQAQGVELLDIIDGACRASLEKLPRDSQSSRSHPASGDDLFVGAIRDRSSARAQEKARAGKGALVRGSRRAPARHVGCHCDTGASERSSCQEKVGRPFLVPGARKFVRKPRAELVDSAG